MMDDLPVIERVQHRRLMSLSGDYNPRNFQRSLSMSRCTELAPSLRARPICESQLVFLSLFCLVAELRIQ